MKFIFKFSSGCFVVLLTFDVSFSAVTLQDSGLLWSLLVPVLHSVYSKIAHI